MQREVIFKLKIGGSMANAFNYRSVAKNIRGVVLSW